MIRGRRMLAAGVLCILISADAMRAQSTAQISGTVHDESGAAVPGAEVRATNTGTGNVRTITTEDTGSYVLTNLPIGSYTIEVTKPGFSKAVEGGIVLQVDSNPTIDVGLRVGESKEAVTVEANALQVETRSTAVGQVVDNVRVAEMPLNGRNPLELVLLTGMASLPGARRNQQCSQLSHDRHIGCGRPGQQHGPVSS